MCGTLLGALVFVFGCGGTQSTDSSSSSSAGYTGAITITNETDTPICGADFYQWYPDVRISSNRFADSPIAQGETRVFERGGLPTERIRLMPCGGTTVLWDSFDPQLQAMWDETEFSGGGQVTLVSSGTQVLAGDSLTLVRENVPFSAYAPRPGALASQHPDIMSSVLAYDQLANFNGDPINATVTSTDWDIERDDYDAITSRELGVWVGVQRPTGQCFFTLWTFSQPHMGGGSYGSGLTFSGGGAMRQIACEVLGGGGSAAAPAAAPAAPAAAPAGGNCTNTCRTSNDGECDDGGPNSLYSICGLGTDCNDCGPR